LEYNFRAASREKHSTLSVNFVFFVAKNLAGIVSLFQTIADRLN
jgi:hypothetical protein